MAPQEGWLITNEESQAPGLPEMRSRVIGRLLAEPVGDLKAGTLLTEQLVERLLAAGITTLRVRSPLTCQAGYGICCHCYGQDLATGKLVKRGVAVGIIAGQSIGEPGTQLTMRTFHSGGIANAQGDITQGLPRINELFEALDPQRAAILAEVAGAIQIERGNDSKRTTIKIFDPLSSPLTDTPLKIYDIAPGQFLLVEDGQIVAVGTPLTTGTRNPKHILDLQGREAAARYLITEAQRVYREAGVSLNDKHMEVIVRQMLRYLQVVEPGDTDLLPGDLIDRFSFTQSTEKAFALGKQPAMTRSVLLGLTKAALMTSSWIAAASFQDTSTVLTNAAIRGQVDPLRGYKERVVLGARIPKNGTL